MSASTWEHLDRIEEQLRRLAHELHPRILDDVGLVTALDFLALGFEKRRGVKVTVEAELPTRLRPAVELAIYRLVQEALSNARKHARAGRVRIRLEHASGSLRCSIADDGIGFEAAALVARLASGEGGMGLSASATASRVWEERCTSTPRQAAGPSSRSPSRRSREREIASHSRR